MAGSDIPVPQDHAPLCVNNPDRAPKEEVASEPYTRPFVCYRCHKPSVATKTLEQLREESRKMFGEYPPNKDVEVCDDCGRQVLEWYASIFPRPN